MSRQVSYQIAEFNTPLVRAVGEAPLPQDDEILLKVKVQLRLFPFAKIFTYNLFSIPTFHFLVLWCVPFRCSFP